MAMRYVLKALGRKTVVCIPACCWAVIDGPFPHSCAGASRSSTAPSRPPPPRPPASRPAWKWSGDTETTVLAWAGDGGTFDIGLQALSGAAERNDDILYVCYDNEAYMNTGIQRSSRHALRRLDDDDAGQALQEPAEEGHRRASWPPTASPTSATASVAYPEDLFKKAKKAKEIKGTRFLHIYRPLPDRLEEPARGHRQAGPPGRPDGIFPLFEVEDGEKYTLNIKLKDKKPIDDYLQAPGPVPPPQGKGRRPDAGRGRPEDGKMLKSC